MIRLFQGSGSNEIVLGEQALPDDQWSRLKAAAARLLRARGRQEAASFLDATPFELRIGSNWFNDEYLVLYLPASLDVYVSLGERAMEKELRASCTSIASTFVELGHYVRFIAVELHDEGSPSPVSTPSLAITSDLVERALAESERAVVQTGAVAGVDRAHTALHGYLRAICARASILHTAEADITQLFKLIQTQHPAMTEQGPRAADVAKVGRAFASVLDALNPLRNRATLAHANEALLPDAEAMLVINGIRTLLHYLNAKIPPEG